MGLLKEILDKIDVHQDPVYIDPHNLASYSYYHKNKDRRNNKGDVVSDNQNLQINISITINDDEE